MQTDLIVWGAMGVFTLFIFFKMKKSFSKNKRKRGENTRRVGHIGGFINNLHLTFPFFIAIEPPSDKEVDDNDFRLISDKVIGEALEPSTILSFRKVTSFSTLSLR